MNGGNTHTIVEIRQRIDDLDACGKNGIDRSDLRPGLLDTHLSLAQELVRHEGEGVAACEVG